MEKLDKTDRKLVLWWALLVILTLLSFEGGIPGLGRPEIVAAIVVAIALIKMRVVILHFMDVKDAPWSLRGVLGAWLLFVGAALLAIWYGYLAIP